MLYEKLEAHDRACTEFILQKRTFLTPSICSIHVAHAHFVTHVILVVQTSLAVLHFRVPSPFRLKFNHLLMWWWNHLSCGVHLLIFWGVRGGGGCCIPCGSESV